MVIEISNGVTRHPAYRMNKPVDFYLCEHEQLAIIGENGAGKSTLLKLLSFEEKCHYCENFEKLKNFKNVPKMF